MTAAGDVNPVTARAWSEVLHAEVGARLGAAGIPCLHIKGPTVATWLYEPGERSWGDVDILLPPSRMDDALEVLLAADFSYRDPGLRWRTSEDHALTLNFDPGGQAKRKAAAEVDVHHRFLGIDGEPERVFAELWRRREPARLAELEVWFPDVTTRSLIAVLNVARDPLGEKAPRDLQRLLAVATDADWARTIALAARVDALQALRAGLELEEAGRDVVARTSLADVTVSSAVRLRAQGSTRTAVRIQELRAFGTWKKVTMVAGWVVPSPAVIRMREPAAAGSPRRMARAYLNRYRQGARELAGSVRDMRRTREPAPPAAVEPTSASAAAAAPEPRHATRESPVAADRLGSGMLNARAAAVARPDGSVVLLGGDRETAAGLVSELQSGGCVHVSDETTTLDPETLEVQPAGQPPAQALEARLLVVPQYDADAAAVETTRLSGGEAAYLAGAGASGLDEITGGPLPALARLARRVPAYRLRYSDPALAAREVDRLWQE